jgi:hypothetical protein
VLAPVEAQPLHVGLDRLDVLELLLGRVGVVEAQVAAPAELARAAEVEADRLGVADVQVAVRLGRERVTTRPPCFPSARSATMRSRMKFGGWSAACSVVMAAPA